MPHTSLTPRAHQLLALLTERGNWVSRAELAKALGKPYLSQYDVTQLQMLEGKGWIEMRDSRVLKRQVWEYRAK